MDSSGSETLMTYLLRMTGEAFNGERLGVNIGLEGNNDKAGIASDSLKTDDVNYLRISLEKGQGTTMKKRNRIMDVMDEKNVVDLARNFYNLFDSEDSSINPRDLKGATVYSVKIRFDRGDLAESRPACIQFSHRNAEAEAGDGQSKKDDYCLCVYSKFPSFFNLYVGLKLLSMMDRNIDEIKDFRVFEDMEKFKRLFILEEVPIQKGEDSAEKFLSIDSSRYGELGSEIKSISCTYSIIKPFRSFYNFKIFQKVDINGTTFYVAYFPSRRGHIYFAYISDYMNGLANAYFVDVELNRVDKSNGLHEMAKSLAGLIADADKK